MEDIELSGTLITEEKIQKHLDFIESKDKQYAEHARLNIEKYRRDIGKYKTILGVYYGEILIALVFKTKDKVRKLKFETLIRIVKMNLSKDYPHFDSFYFNSKEIRLM